MAIVLRLPRELQDFINGPGARSLLIRGAPGTGKTILSLAILEHFPRKRILVSSRVPEPELLHQLPELERLMRKGLELIDGSDGGLTVRATARLQGDPIHGLLKADAGRDGVSEFLWLPPALQDAWSRMPLSEGTIVVIDSWDALIERYLGVPPTSSELLPNRDEIERLLLARMSRSNLLLVLVVERDTPTQLDYLADGVVRTSLLEEDERLERWVALSKLRGTAISSVQYPFTLAQGRFECVLPALTPTTLDRPLAEPETPGPPEHMWPGSSEFARVFGWLPFGKITLIMTDEEITTETVRILTVPFFASTLRAQGRVLFVPPPTVFPKEVVRTFANGHFGTEQFRNHVRMISTNGADGLPPDLAGVVLELPQPSDLPAFPGTTLRRSTLEEASNDPSSLAGTRLPEALAWVRGGNPAIPNALIGWIDGVELVLRQLGATDGMSILAPGLARYVGGRPAHAIMIGRESHPLVNSLKSIASTLIRLRIRHGRPILHGLRPWTPNYLLTVPPEAEQASRPFVLLQIA